MKPVDVISQAFNRWMWRRCAEADQTFFDTDRFDWVAPVESRWREIRAELDVLLERQAEIPAFYEVSERERPFSDDQWKTFFFRVYGNDIPEARRLCPATAAIVDQHPEWTTVFFSILDPGKHIVAHHGPYKGVLRYHLGLIVPTGEARCAIRVGQDIRGWREGESLIFDDTHDHEVWNDASARRVVLFVDFVRPMPGLVGFANRAMLSAARRLHPDVREIRRKASAFCRSMMARRAAAERPFSTT